MQSPTRIWRAAIAAGALTLSTFTGAAAEDRPPTPKETSMSATASGDFDVELQPLAPDEGWGEFGRMSIDKRFRGDLDAASKGVMLAAQTAVKGSAGYVAFERVTGTLSGRRGSFILQHSGTMAPGVEELSVAVVPNSGTDALAGLAGSMEIEIDESGHRYTLRYTLPRDD